MNWQVTNQIKDYFNELDQLLFYLSLAGSAFKKIYFDNSLDRIYSVLVPAEDFVISYDNTDLETAERYTQVMKLSRNEIKRRQIEGFYKDVPLSKTETTSNQFGTVEQTMERLQGMTPSMSDKIHTILEIHANLDIGEDENGLALPYIVTVDQDSTVVLAIRRNWKEDDPLKRKRTYLSIESRAE